MIYFNTGSLGRCPKPVLTAFKNYTGMLESNPTIAYWEHLFPLATEARKCFADFLSVNEDEVFFATSTTDGVYQVLNGLSLKPGDRILTTNLEYETLRDAFQYLEKHRGIQVRVLDLPLPLPDDKTIVASFEKAFTEDFQALVMSHVVFMTGDILPVQQIAALAKRKNCFVFIDGAQAAGVVPLQLKDLGCDAYALPGHKWLLGPKGTGFFYLSQEAQPKMKSIDFCRASKNPASIRGVMNLPAILSLKVAIDYFNDLGWEFILQRRQSLMSALGQHLNVLQPLKCMSRVDDRKISPMIAFAAERSSGQSRSLPEYLFKKHGITVRDVAFPSGASGIRISLNIDNSEKELDNLVKAIQGYLR